MQRHAPTLKTLHLSNIFLVEGTWDSAFRRLKKALNLQEVEFSGMFGVPALAPYVFDVLTLPFEPRFHLPMSSDIGGYIVRLGGKEPLGVSLAKFLLEGGDDEDPLKEWGGDVLPDGVQVVWEWGEPRE